MIEKIYWPFIEIFRKAFYSPWGWIVGSLLGICHMFLQFKLLKSHSTTALAIDNLVLTLLGLAIFFLFFLGSSASAKRVRPLGAVRFSDKRAIAGRWPRFNIPVTVSVTNDAVFVCSNPVFRIFSDFGEVNQVIPVASIESFVREREFLRLQWISTDGISKWLRLRLEDPAAFEAVAALPSRQ